MRKEEQLRLLKGLINHLDAKTNIDAGGIIRTPAETYTSSERFDREWDTFFLIIHKSLVCQVIFLNQIHS